MNDQTAILQFEEAKKILRGMRSNRGSQEPKINVTTTVGCRSDLYAMTQELRQKVQIAEILKVNGQSLRAGWRPRQGRDEEEPAMAATRATTGPSTGHKHWA